MSQILDSSYETLNLQHFLFNVMYYQLTLKSSQLLKRTAFNAINNKNYEKAVTIFVFFNIY
jgi:hypothetical protein